MSVLTGLPVRLKRRDHQICSELVVRALQAGGLLKEADPPLTLPADLAKWFNIRPEFEAIPRADKAGWINGQGADSNRSASFRAGGCAGSSSFAYLSRRSGAVGGRGLQCLLGR